MHCGGCMRSVERAALERSGRREARANRSPPSGVSVTYDAARAGEADLIAALAQAGFVAAPIEAAKQDARYGAPEHDLLRRVAVAGFAAMNIMLLSVSVWSGDGGDMDPALAVAVPLAVGAHRVAHGRLCRAAVLRLGARRAEGPAPQHGRADLARHPAGDGHEPLPDHASAASRSISMRPCRSCSFC